MSQTAQSAISVIGIDIGKNSFHIVGHDDRLITLARHFLSLNHPELRAGQEDVHYWGSKAHIGN